MAELTVFVPTLTGTVKPALVAAASGGDTFDNDGKTLLEVNNADAGAHTLTITGQNTSQTGKALTETKSIGAGETQVFGPFDPAFFNDGNGEVQISFDAVTSVTVGAYSANATFN